MRAIFVVTLALSWTPAITQADALVTKPPISREGYADLRCTVTVVGTMTNCRVLAEKPEGYGFGAAALKMSSIFKVKPRSSDGRSVESSTWTTRIHFRLGKASHVDLGPGGPTPGLLQAPVSR